MDKFKYRMNIVRTRVFDYLDWLAESQDAATIDITHITQAYDKITRKLAQELLDQWREERTQESTP